MARNGQGARAAAEEGRFEDAEVRGRALLGLTAALYACHAWTWCSAVQLTLTMTMTTAFITKGGGGGRRGGGGGGKNLGNMLLKKMGYKPGEGEPASSLGRHHTKG